MGYSNDDTTGDFEKLQKAIGELTQMFGSVEGLLEAFGLANMPSAQRYGIMFGCLVFLCTITSVVALLILGGSFKRIAEQTETGETTLKTSSETRKERALLLEQLLEGRTRMGENYKESIRTSELTPLTKMLLNVAPSYIPKEEDIDLHSTNDKSSSMDKDIPQPEQLLPQLYKENFLDAYHKCLDKPGGPVLSGCPEARFESYARAYAGCGPYTTRTYRRSYGRIYEALCCKNHLMNDKYNQLFRERPLDIIGRNVRLEALEMNRHLDGLHLVLSGVSAFENIAYDPHEVWGFLEDGPFENKQELSESYVFNRKFNEAGFAIAHSVTNRTLGVILLTNDDPTNLSIQIEPPILSPNNNGTLLQLESCFLLMDRLFGYGYRRIQLSIDSQDAEKRKLCVRLGFSFEGILYKHMVVKDSSRDSSIYSMLNSDWKRGARTALFKTLYGVPAYQFDVSNEKHEEEMEQQRLRKEQKRLQELEELEKNTKKKL